MSTPVEVKYTILKALTDCISEASTNEAWAIFHQGKQIKTVSGKSVWQKKQHASAAFTNHIKELTENRRFLNQFPDLSFKEFTAIRKSATKDFLTSGIFEIKKISG